MYVAQVEAVIAKWGRFSMNTTIKVPVEDCLIFPDSSSVSGPVHVCWTYKPRPKRKSSPFFLSRLEVGKTGILKTSVSGVFGHQGARLKASGYSNAVMRGAV